MTWAQTHADALSVHPITLIGRLQNDGLLSWKTTLVRDAPNVTDQLERWTALVPSLNDVTSSSPTPSSGSPRTAERST